MATREELQQRLEYWKTTLGKLMDAYLALVEGQVKSYEIDDRQLTRLDLPSLKKAINDAEGKVDLGAITITAYACQAQGFDSASAAWTACFGS